MIEKDKGIELVDESKKLPKDGKDKKGRVGGPNPQSA